MNWQLLSRNIAYLSHYHYSQCLVEVKLHAPAFIAQSIGLLLLLRTFVRILNYSIKNFRLKLDCRKLFLRWLLTDLVRKFVTLSQDGANKIIHERVLLIFDCLFAILENIFHPFVW